MSLITFQKPIRVPHLDRSVRAVACEGVRDKKFEPGPVDLSARIYVTAWIIHHEDSPEGRGTLGYIRVEETRLEIDIENVLSVVG